MTRSSLLALCLLCIACVFSAEPARAGDEDLSSSAYLVFDPETGEFVTVQDPNRAKQNHEALQPDASGGGDTTKPGPKTASILPLAAGGVLVAGLLVSAIVLLRRRKRGNA